MCTLFKLGDPARDDVKTESTLVYTALGTDQAFGPASFKTSAEDRANQVECAKIVTKLFAEGTLKPLEVTDVGGLETVEKGMKMLQSELERFCPQFVRTFADVVWLINRWRELDQAGSHHCSGLSENT